MEILVSVSILAVVSTLIAQVLFTATHVNRKTELLGGIKQDGNFALDVISRMVRSADAIETSCPVGQTLSPSAQIRNADNNTTIFTCLSDGNVARIASVSATGGTTYLTRGSLTVSTSGGTDCTDSSLSFSCPPASGVQNQMTVTFTLRQPGDPGNAFESGASSFQSIVRLRN